MSKIAEDNAAAQSVSDDPLAKLLNRPSQETAGPFNGAVVGELLAIQEADRTLLVSYPGQLSSGAVAARSTVDLSAPDVGRQVVLVFENGEPDKPIIIGLVNDSPTRIVGHSATVEISSDGERVILNAKEELVLRCGPASMTLTKDGRVILRGVHVSTHAEGVNRIKGGSVQIN